MISAKRKRGIGKIIPTLENYIPNEKWIFPKNQYTNTSLKFQNSEITREKIFQLLNKELPYSMKIETSINSQENIIKVNQNIIINKESQKAIFIGKKGEKIKEIGIRARKDIEKILENKVFLKLSVSLKSYKKKN